jgi:hypothetical protein
MEGRRERDVKEGDRTRAKEKGQSAHVKTEGMTQPLVYLRNSPCQMGRDKKDRQARKGGERYSRYSKGRKCNLSVCSWSRQPGSLYHPFPRTVLFSQGMIHHYPIAQSRIFSHVHVLLEPPSEFLPRRVPQSSCQSHPRWYRQVLHPVRRKFGRRRISPSYSLWKLLEWYRVMELFCSLHILGMQCLQAVRRIFQFEFRLPCPVKEAIFRQKVLMPPVTSLHCHTRQSTYLGISQRGPKRVHPARRGGVRVPRLI